MCRSCTDVTKTYDRAPNSKVGVRYSLRVKNLNADKLIRKPSYSVMGRIDIFDLLKSLPPRLFNSVDLTWMQTMAIVAKNQSYFRHPW